MSNINFGTEYLKELELEVRSTHRCLERIPETLFQWKPHEKSMGLGDLALLVADIPLWIAWSIEKGVIDLATYEHFRPKNTAELVKRFEENIAAAKRALQNISNEDLEKSFELRNKSQVLMKTTQTINVITCINHMVHHRGQLTVYMRLNDILVPSIYGPSADERTF